MKSTRRILSLAGSGDLDLDLEDLCFLGSEDLCFLDLEDLYFLDLEDPSSLDSRGSVRHSVAERVLAISGLAKACAVDRDPCGTVLMCIDCELVDASDIQRLHLRNARPRLQERRLQDRRTRAKPDQRKDEGKVEVA